MNASTDFSLSMLFFILRKSVFFKDDPGNTGPFLHTPYSGRITSEKYADDVLECVTFYFLMRPGVMKSGGAGVSKLLYQIQVLYAFLQLEQRQ